MYSVIAAGPGNWVDKGIRVSASGGGTSSSVDALSAAITCAYARHPILCPQAMIDRVQAIVQKER